MKKVQSKTISRREFFMAAGICTMVGISAACRLESVTNQIPTLPDGDTTTQPPPYLPEVVTTPPPPNLTGEERLQTEYHLTPANAKIFWLFITNKGAPLGRKEIARQLNISPNTLKDHITRIIRHVGSSGNPDVYKINDAVTIVLNH